MSDHAFSVIIPWYNRPELSQTLQENLAVFSSHKNIEVIVLNGGGDQDLFRTILTGDVTAYNLPIPEFNKGLCMNLAAYLAKTPNLFFWDADMILNSDPFEEMVEMVSQGRYFVTMKKVLESEGGSEDNGDGCLQEMLYFLEITSKDGRKARVETDMVHFGEECKTGIAQVFLSKDHFIGVNGMNSRLEGWGWEDLDLVVRLQLELGLEGRKSGSGIHLTHDDSKRYFKGSTRKENDRRNFMICLSNYQAGKFLGSYTADVQRWKDEISFVTI